MPFSFADAIFWIAVACCAVAQIAIVRSVVVFAGARRDDVAPPPSAARAQREIAWAVLPGIALALVMVWTWRTMHAAPHLGPRRLASCSDERDSATLVAALVVACLHLVFGAIVRISGSGMGCGNNWPKCYGYWFPPFSRPDLVVEVSHRYLASILVITVASMALVAFRASRANAGVGGPRWRAALRSSAPSPRCSRPRSSAA